MKLFHVPVIFFLVFIFSDQTNAQQLKENEIVVIQGNKYVLHQVRTGETIFSISRDFQVDRSELIESNPEIANKGLDIGQILKIPYKENLDISNNPVFQKGDPTGFISHTIESRKETPYFIAKKYGITVEEIFAYNPEVQRFRKGAELRIPVWEKPAEPNTMEVGNETNEADVSDKPNLSEYTVLPGETLYSISHKYNVPESEILFLNPEAKNLKAGAKIYLPIKEVVDEVQPNIKTEELKNNTKYFEHTIESGETMWGLTRNFNVTEDELIALNPVLKNAFPAGVVIKIPLNEASDVKVTAVNDDAFIDHFVEKNETLYGLAQKYHVSIPEIKQYNPGLENRHPMVGELVLIPRKPEQAQVQDQDQALTQTNEPGGKLVQPDTQENAANINTDSGEEIVELPASYYNVEVEVEIPESCIPKYSFIQNNNNFDIALFLPLYLEANDTLNREIPEILTDSLMLENNVILADTLIEREEPKELFKQFYSNSESFLEFYEGVLIAIDSMQNEGMNVRLHVFDTQNNADSVRKIINSEDFSQTDLIIGPVYPEVQGEVARISSVNQIPMVSPFASRSEYIKDNSWYYQINPDREYINKETAEMVTEEYFNSNIIIVRMSPYEGTPEGRLVDLIREKLYISGNLNKIDGARFTVYDFKNEGTFGLRRIMAEDRENVIIIPTAQAGELSVAISNINNLADDFSITLIGTSNYQQRYPSIDVAQFHNLKLKYIYPYWVDYENQSTIAFIEKFKSNFATEPNSFGMQGFDVAYYFLNALRYYGSGFGDCMPYLHLNLTQGNYHFQKISQTGGFMNQGVSVISYTRDYRVLRERIKGQPKLVAVNQ